MISLLAADLVLLSVERRVCGRVRRDLGLSARQHLLRRDESDGAVQRDLVVSHILANQAPRILGRQPVANPYSDGELPSPAECRQPTPGSTGRSQPPLAAHSITTSAGIKWTEGMRRASKKPRKEVSRATGPESNRGERANKQQAENERHDQ